MFKRKITIPSEELQQIDGVETYVVCWIRRINEYYGGVEKCYQAFTDKDSAQTFAESIRVAHKLIGNTSGIEVTIKIQNSGL